MAETLKLCVSCKACRRECPTGVDMARMKIEVQAARVAKHGLSLRDRLVGYLPRYAPFAARLARLANLRDDMPRLRAAGRRNIAGLSARREPAALAQRCRGASRRVCSAPTNAREVVLFADTFNRYFEPENIEAALGVLTAAGYARASAEARGRQQRGRSAAGARSCRSGWSTRRGARPSAASPRWRRSSRAACRSSGSSRAASSASATRFRRCSRATTRARLAAHALLFEEFLAREAHAGTLDLPLKPVAKRALLHGHCHQKSFGAMGAVEAVLKLVPELAVETVESSCCGMAGAFGYGADTIDVSLKMARAVAAAGGAQGRGRYAGASPTAPPAAIRSRTAAGARRCTSRACWR